MQGGRGKSGPQPWAEAEITEGLASRFARNTLEAVRREYPNKLDHVLAGPQDVLPPGRLHPAFYGCFDWHSAVHGHWMLARLLRRFPGLPEGPDLRAVLDRHLAPERISVEVAYFVNPAHRGFERTYGWAWLLKLAGELGAWAEARAWAEALRPLAEAVAAAFRDYLPGLAYPNRVGTHANTAFSLNLALDYARTAGDRALEALLEDRVRAFFARDRNGPLAWEPSGEDFLSPCLEEAALVGKVLDREAFHAWLAAFLPDLLAGTPLEPAKVGDRTDPRTVHLDGLNLSRARCLTALAAALGPGDPRAAGLERAARDHARAALPHVVSGRYVGDHWLGTFAVQLL
jgi:hypothetical protein